ncbi:Hypothetical protein I595_870 [Croceitalea dokdonensis DOKDO 023]|uniref:Uncharacterized protein n=1 Tax=Croceitalea dokdonensis DOKDO 023 TaxID=1300341 RepID=A0A0P7AKU0_9FLAO|nr:Hypothetical protein I595_870 [Croceitalea dokdonensis DOKDO 023]
MWLNLDVVLSGLNGEGLQPYTEQETTKNGCCFWQHHKPSMMALGNKKKRGDKWYTTQKKHWEALYLLG